MKLIFFVVLLVCSNGEFIKKYPQGSYIKSCRNIAVDGNMLCAITKHERDWKTCIIFDECSYIENINYELVDKRLDNCNTNYKISILEQKIDLIIKYINLEQDKKYTELINFFQLK